MQVVDDAFKELFLFCRSSLETQLSKLMSVPNPSTHSGTRSGSNLR